ncbi:MAG: aminopeptidase [Erysipelotrichaceae bacterium]|nr:aminopeptidase [Erysipelotrichaceae bacterium]
MNQTRLEKYARVLLEVGVNLQKGETLVLQTITECMPLAREITKQAFAMGAKDVVVHIDDPEINHLRAKNCDVETLKEVPEWKKESLDYYFRQGNVVQMGLMASYPTLNEDVPSEKLLAQNYASNEVRNVVRQYIHAGTLKWTGTCTPSMNWAAKLYPDMPLQDAYDKLDDEICQMMRVDDTSDPVENWKEHCATLGKVSKKLNEYDFKSLHITSELGTDITMDLVEGHMWTSAADMGSSKVSEPYVANMPTEEIFTDPHRLSVNGVAYASFPLMMSGKLVTDFSITFKDGMAVDCHASNNEECLRDALFKNENTRQLGEVALVSKRSPIKLMNHVFYNGLIDENAACHLAFGTSFPSNINGGADMSKEELLAHGVNVATSHNDFMIGTPETKVVGTTHDGREVVIMEHGDFVI